MVNYLDLDFVEYYVYDADKVAWWHVEKLGFNIVGRLIKENDSSSFLIRKDNIKLLITSADPSSKNEITAFLLKHGEGIKRIGFSMLDIEGGFYNAVKNGAVPVQEPTEFQDEYGVFKTASIKLFENNELVFVDRSSYSEVHFPSYEISSRQSNFNSKLVRVDHIAYAVGKSEICYWENFFNNLLDSSTVLTLDSSERESLGMSMKVLQSENKKIINVISEPVNNSTEISQIQIFVDENKGNGIQHLAFESSNIFDTVRSLRESGIALVAIPDSYYKLLAEKHRSLEVSRLQEYGILCDVVEDSLLLQIFTKPLGSRPTLFYEFIQRVNDYKGFGIGNIRTLFEAVQYNLGRNEKEFFEV